MICLRRANLRRHDRCDGQDVWLTFFSQQPPSALDHGFGSLECLNEVSLAPGAHLAGRMQPGAEVVTYVREGSLALDDIKGGRIIVQAGEYRRTNATRAVCARGMNASRSAWVHFFQICLSPAGVDPDPACEQKRFSTADRRGGLLVVASQDASKGSLLVHQQATILSAILDPGQHVVHELTANRSAWLHLVRGEAALGDITLTTGDGAGLVGERSVSFTARDTVEVLLIDLGAFPTASCRTGLVQPPDMAAGT